MPNASRSALTKTIVDQETEFLQSMERIVRRMEVKAARDVFRLRLSAATIAASVIALLIGLGWFVIRPATVTIRRQVEDLEWRVVSRTRELSTALQALRSEVAKRQQSDVKTQRLAAQLAHAERIWSMSHLTAGLAHELNHPLATIANYAEACDLQLTRFEIVERVEELRNYLVKTKHAALRAGEIIRRMRNFIRPSTPVSNEVEFNGLIHDVLELCQYEISQSGAQVEMQLACDRCAVAVDPIQIQQVLVNLIQNALQAMQSCPSCKRRIRIVSSVTIDSVQVEVADSGPGFALSDSDTVFQPFYTTKRDGLGLGLSVCRTIVEQHGGSIWATTAPCEGACIAFTLPRNDNVVRSRQTQYECVCR